MIDNLLLIDRAGNGIVTVTLNRSEVRNAFDEAMIAELTETFTALDRDETVRAIVLRGAGEAFCAGGDLNWMRRTADFDTAENEADAAKLAAMLAAVDGCRKPTVALVHGAAMGGGIGLVAACDVAVAVEGTTFALSEVRLGLIPAVISPYVTCAMGFRQARRYAVTGEVFDAAEAVRCGLVHQVVPTVAALDEAAQPILHAILLGGPAAQADAKRLIDDVAGQPIDAALQAMTAQRIAARRAADEAREGVGAFLEKRAPSWREDAP